jgi:hypothetical protein
MSIQNSEKDLSTFLTIEKMNEWTDPQEWARMLPSLSFNRIGKKQSDNNTSPTAILSPSSTPPFAQLDKGRCRRDLQNDGYTLVDEQPDPTLVHKLAEGISKLNDVHKLPASFILLSDEAWQLADTCSRHLQNKINHPSNVFNFDVLAWCVDPSQGVAGFSPHRDRQPRNKDIADSFHQDGQAKYVTLWMALSDATPENSCLYVIPKEYDPGYLKGDDLEEEGNDHDDGNDGKDEKHFENGKGISLDNDTTTSMTQDPLARCLQSKEAYQCIRALPRKTGQSLAFTHRIIHWGSRGSLSCKSPRIAISFVMSDPSFEKPYLKEYGKYLTSSVEPGPESEGESLPLRSLSSPPFHLRLLLVCAQMLIYYQRFNLPKETIRACYKYCEEHKNELEENYWKKVSYEFVNAMKEIKFGASKNPLIGACDSGNLMKLRTNHENSEDSDSDDDALLQATLENANDAEDDFDEMCYEAAGESEEEDFDNDDDDECLDLFSLSRDEPTKKKMKT